MSAYATDLGICYGQVAIDDKSNEITAIPNLLDKISVKGCLISIDAMGTQKEIANKIIKKQADYCLAVKENQKSLLEDIQPFFNVGKRETDSYETVEKSHGQIETRRYEVIKSLRIRLGYARNTLTGVISSVLEKPVSRLIRRANKVRTLVTLS